VDLPSVELVPGVLVPDEANFLYADVYVPTTRDGGNWEEVDYGQRLKTLDATDSRDDSAGSSAT
jgi:hypothetical protein